jgi:serine/threonine-protein kinase
MPAPGDRLESFELREAIGVGGMGAVFLAEDTRLDRQVALKVLPPEQSNDPETVQRFYQEGRAAARLDHENIARIYTIGADQGYHYIAFEYIEGVTIRRRVEDHGPLSVAETINYTLQIANALVHACERGVVHRDIKPSNIVVTPQGRAKLVDMGLARRFERGVADDGLTQSGMTLGTFDYISPEQARDPRGVDVRSDLYSLGCTMFHMLTGRPPFPEGTVLQKLLQHQEEPAPDVRTLNPHAPADLAAILLKLMEKDRDRRYQTPEQLARDLLGLAGSLGLRSVSPEGLVWMTNAPAPSWERHLVWGLPAICLALVVAALFWWGQRGEGPSAAAPPAAPATARAGPQAVPPRVRVAESPEAPAAPGADARPSAVEPGFPAGLVRREVPVGADEDLAELLAIAPSGTTLILTDDGPYTLRPTPTARPGAVGTPGRDLTIRPAAGAHPVLRQGRTPGGPGGESALLAFRGGRVRLEGLTFLLDPAPGDPAVAAVSAEDAELEVAACRFRRPDPASGARGVSATAVRVRNAPASPAGEAPAPTTRLAGCHLDGGQVGLRVSGPAAVALRSCTFGPAEPAVWLDNAAAPAPVPAELDLRLVTILAGPSAVFRFDGTAARVAVDESVVAPPGAGAATLVATDQPDRLDWFGRGNLYGRVGVYLQPAGDARGAPIAAFAAWEGNSRLIRESRSESTDARVWALADPAAALASPDPSPAFRLADLAPAPAEAPRSPSSEGGEPRLRPGMFAALLEQALARRAARAGDRDADAPGGSAPAESPPSAARARAGGPGVGGADVGVAVASAGAASGALALGVDDADLAPGEALGPMPSDAGAPMTPPSADPMTLAPAAPMPVAAPDPVEAGPGTSGSSGARGGSEPSRALESRPDPDPAASPGREADGGDGTARPADPAIGAVLDPAGFLFGPGAGEALAAAAPVRTGADLERRVRGLDARGGTIRLAAGADLGASGLEVPRGSRLVLEAEPGAPRPTLRFRAAPGADRRPSEPAALFRVAPGGSLELRGIDVVLPGREATGLDRWAAFAVGAGTDLSLDRCTVTVEGTEPSDPDEGPSRSALVAVVPDAGSGGPADVSAATVHANECLLRGRGDLADVAAGRRLDLGLTQCVAAVTGSLAHGHGLPRSRFPEPIKLTLRQVTARAEGGLVRLESAPGESELPIAEVVARDSVVATDEEGGPLFRVEGQDSLDALGDRIHWEGHGVVYHRIDTYRRDETALAGTAPLGFKRSSWERAVGNLEDNAYHGDADFLDPWDARRPLWTATAEDMRLAPESPTPAAGPDLRRIPRAPAPDA